MDLDALPEDWAVLREWLPENLEEHAREHGFIKRERGVTVAELWLRVILMHVGGGLSLEQTAMRARELGFMDVSGVALFKRLQKAHDWLAELCAHLLREHRRRLGSSSWPAAYRVRAIDATDIQEPGSTGTDWRMHFSIRFPELVCDHYELTDDTGGERLGRFSFQPGDLILADRGYSHRKGVAAVLDANADVLIRWNPHIFPLIDEGGQPFKPLVRLRSVRIGKPASWMLAFEFGERTYPLRLCAVRKSRLATERARKKVLDKARRNRTRPSPTALGLCAYTLILTSLPQTQFPAQEVLQLYRGRWQVELSFKRLKSLLDAGQIPKSSDISAKAWMQAKILTALLIERVLLEASVFSPWGYRICDREPMEALP